MPEKNKTEHLNLYYIFKEDKSLHPMLIRKSEIIRKNLNKLFMK